MTKIGTLLQKVRTQICSRNANFSIRNIALIISHNSFSPENRTSNMQYKIALNCWEKKFNGNL